MIFRSRSLDISQTLEQSPHLQKRNRHGVTTRGLSWKTSGHAYDQKLAFSNQQYIRYKKHLRSFALINRRTKYIYSRLHNLFDYMNRRLRRS